jgi:asparagine synthase (glutamine-hydrolysing)
MCGIAGIIQVNPVLTEEVHLKNMTNALAHRGPDGEGSWMNEGGHAMLGHRRLSIIDLSEAAAQPMHCLGRYRILHNGEIYNYVELRQELVQSGYKFHTQSDTEVIAMAYDQWGDECVTHFDGMFAFVIWDEKTKELFAARDRFGEKPFFYFFDGKTLLFASEMKGIWAAGIPKEPNQQLLFNFLTIGYVDNPSSPGETFYNNICKLPPASRLYYSWPDSELVIEQYWDIDTRTKNKNISDREVLEHFNILLVDSVKKRLRSDVPIGTSLSGGIDSSSIVASIHSTNILSYPADAFTAVFPGFAKDEAPHSAQVAIQFGLPHHTIAINPDELVDEWEKICYHQEEPFGSASIYAQFKVYGLAKKHGVKVLLDGQGADETLAGYHKYYKWYWQELFVRRKLISSGELKAARNLGIQEDFGIKNIIASLFPDLANVVLERQYLLRALRQEDLTREFVKEQSREAYYTTPEYFDLSGALYFNTCIHGLEELLRYADRNSMAHGREIRLPFLSHHLVEFLFSLPSHFKIRQGWTKWLLRKLMENILPDHITWRKDKIGFEPPQKNWMQSESWTDMIMEARKKMVAKGILKKEVLVKPVLALDSHAANNYDWRYLAAAPFL